MTQTMLRNRFQKLITVLGFIALIVVVIGVSTQPKNDHVVINESVFKKAQVLQAGYKKN